MCSSKANSLASPDGHAELCGLSIDKVWADLSATEVGWRARQRAAQSTLNWAAVQPKIDLHREPGVLDRAMQIANDHLNEAGRNAIMQAVDFKRMTTTASPEKLNEIKQKLSTEYQPAGGVQVAQHAFGIDEHGIHEVGGFGEKVVEQNRGVGQDVPVVVNDTDRPD